MHCNCLVLMLAIVLSGCSESADKLLRERYPADGPGAAVAVVRDGRVLYSNTFGLANLEHRIPVSNETVFDGASLAKQFTAFAALQLVLDGQLKLDEEIDPHVTGFFPIAANKRITIRHLLNHTSGIRDYVWATTTTGRRFDDVQTSAHMERFLINQNGFNDPPGRAWVYNNTGYFILGKIIAEKANTSFSAYVHKTIFQPFGMKDTFFLEDPTEIIVNRAESYGPPNEFCYGLPPGSKIARCIDSTALPGPASLMTTLPDMTKWLVQINKGLSSNDPRFSQLFSVLTSNAKPKAADCGPINSPKVGYAGGMYLDEIENVGVACHGGTWRGFRGMVLFVPKYKLGIVILSNRGDDLPYLRDTAFALARLFEPALQLSVTPLPPRPAHECAVAPVTDFVGKYYSPELQMALTFDRDDAGRLVAGGLQRESVQLCRSSGDTFRNAESFWLAKAKFVRDQGHVTAVEISTQTGAEDILFTLLPPSN